ncbi:GNAT family N-acetyltransferase [Yoonia sp. 208BN28-4]|uniref:GNAT family N-acetyltransferase n=1 Tax=Yoonia sp. 208BN28-4 TaxID=3126505 RepID=UPI00309C412F
MIRPAREADDDAMAATLGAWVAETDWMPKLHSPDEDRWFCGHLIETGLVWVADCRDGLGFLASKDNEVAALYLPPALRGQGWGRALLTAAKAGRNRLTLWTFQANTRAIAFYQREGFVVGGFTDGRANAEKLPDAHLIWERDA